MASTTSPSSTSRPTARRQPKVNPAPAPWPLRDSNWARNWCSAGGYEVALRLAREGICEKNLRNTSSEYQRCEFDCGAKCHIYFRFIEVSFAYQQHSQASLRSPLHFLNAALFNHVCSTIATSCPRFTKTCITKTTSICIGVPICLSSKKVSFISHHHAGMRSIRFTVA